VSACIYDKSNNTNKNPAVAKEGLLQPIQFLLQYWPSKSSKVNDFSYHLKRRMPLPFSD